MRIHKNCRYTLLPVAIHFASCSNTFYFYKIAKVAILHKEAVGKCLMFAWLYKVSKATNIFYPSCLLCDKLTGRCRKYATSPYQE